MLYLYFYNGYCCSLKLTFNKQELCSVIFRFIIHTVKIIRVCVDILHKPQINMFYIFKMKKNILYIFYGLCILYFVVLSIHKVKKTERCNVCTHCINHICVAINISSLTAEQRSRGRGWIHI